MTSGTGKVYPQSVSGKYRSIKNSVNYALLFVYFLAPGLGGTENKDCLIKLL